MTTCMRHLKSDTAVYNIPVGAGRTVDERLVTLHNTDDATAVPKVAEPVEVFSYT